MSALPDIRSVVGDVEFGAWVEIFISSDDGRRYALKTTPEQLTHNAYPLGTLDDYHKTR